MLFLTTLATFMIAITQQNVAGENVSLASSSNTTGSKAGGQRG
jgi:hypothetical protein